MVVNRHREHALSVILTNGVIIKHVFNLLGRWHAILGFNELIFILFADDIHAEFDAFVTDKDGRPCDQLAYFMLALAAEAAIERIF